LKVPLAFKSLYDGRGGILVAGVTIIALVLSAVALGLTGLGVAVFFLVLVAFIELWREVIRYEASVATLETTAQAGNAAVNQVKDLERQISDLKVKNRELLRQASSPSSSHEGLLAAITVHLSVLGLVEKHRAMREDVPDAPITQAEISVGGNVKLTANCPGSPEMLVGESIVIIDSRSREQISAISTVDGSNGSDVFVHFEERGLPTELVENVRQLDRLIPDGYSLRLAGLIKDFDGISDESLHALVAALEEARGSIHVVLKEAGRKPGIGEVEEEMKELEID
jgi:hypothetical protein